MPPFKLLSSLVLGSRSLDGRDGQGAWTQMESVEVEGLEVQPGDWQITPPL